MPDFRQFKKFSDKTKRDVDSKFNEDAIPKKKKKDYDKEDIEREKKRVAGDEKQKKTASLQEMLAL